MIPGQTHTAMPSVIYLDYNATTPVAKPVIKAVSAALESLWGNPSSGHGLGVMARGILEQARARMAGLLRAAPEEVLFQSGGTEANNTVLLGLARGLASQGRHLVTTEIEHPSVLNPCLHLLEEGWKVTFVQVNGLGMVDPKEVERACTQDTVLVSVMLANNETGVLQPVREIARRCRERGILVHTDAAQAVGKIPVDVNNLGVDYLTVAGHKLYAPKGIGALYCRGDAPFERILFGAGQERGRRPGTEPVPLAVGLGAACDFVSHDLAGEASRQRILRERLFEGLSGLGYGVVRHGTAEHTLPNTLSISIAGQDGADMLRRAPRVMASTGAACHDRSVKVSHVLAAMGVTPEVARGTLRFSLGRFTSENEIDQAVREIGGALSS